jgi:RNAse (barnase) inhibitor barstar
MKTTVVTIPVAEITDWPSFHTVFQRALGFPDFYGRNLDAWIDCMTSVDAPEDCLTTVNVQPGEILVLTVNDPFDFRRRCPEQFDALIECSAFVNFRRVEVGEPPLLAILLNGRI